MQQIFADDNVIFHHLVLLIGQPAFLFQYLGRYQQFADVVHHRGYADIFYGVVVVAHALSQYARVFRNALDVLAGLPRFCLGYLCESQRYLFLRGERFF